MPESITPTESPDRTLERTVRELELETGIPDDDRAILTPGSRNWGIFKWAYRQQDSWWPDELADFWRGVIAEWPHRPGGERVRERLGYAVRRGRRDGASDADIAQALGYSLDSLRRMGAFQLAESLPDLAVTAYVLPRIFGPDDPIPDPMAYPTLDQREIVGSDVRTAQFTDGLAAIGG